MFETRSRSGDKPIFLRKKLNSEMICEKKYSIDDDDIGWDRETDKEKEEDKERKTKTKTKNIGRRIISTAKDSRRIRHPTISFSRVHVTLHPALSVHWSVGWLVGRSVTLLFFMIFFLWPHCSCPNGLVTSNMAPAHPHATSVLFFLNSKSRQ